MRLKSLVWNPFALTRAVEKRRSARKKASASAGDFSFTPCRTGISDIADANSGIDETWPSTS